MLGACGGQAQVSFSCCCSFSSKLAFHWYRCLKNWLCFQSGLSKTQWCEKKQGCSKPVLDQTLNPWYVVGCFNLLDERRNHHMSEQTWSNTNPPVEELLRFPGDAGKILVGNHAEQGYHSCSVAFAPCIKMLFPPLLPILFPHRVNSWRCWSNCRVFRQTVPRETLGHPNDFSLA